MKMVFVALIFSMFAYLMADETPISAIAVLKSSNGHISGVVRFEQNQTSSLTHVYVNITGLPPGDHGFHIHQFGDLSNGCISAGPHFNPNALTHGSPNDTVRHVGDLGNLEANSAGDSVFELKDKQIQLSGSHSVIGRAVVVHELKDDLGLGTGTKEAESKKTGNAGARIACAVIGIAMN